MPHPHCWQEFDETWATLREALPETASTAFVTATLPGWLVQRVQEELPLTKVLKGNKLHRTADLLPPHALGNMDGRNDFPHTAMPKRKRSKSSKDTYSIRLQRKMA